MQNKTKKKCCKPINGLIKKFPHIYQFCNGDFKKFVLLLRKGVYSYEHMDGWERFDETLLPDKKAFDMNPLIRILNIQKKQKSNLKKISLS